MELNLSSKNLNWNCDWKNIIIRYRPCGLQSWPKLINWELRMGSSLARSLGAERWQHALGSSHLLVRRKFNGISSPWCMVQSRTPNFCLSSQKTGFTISGEAAIDEDTGLISFIFDILGEIGIIVGACILEDHTLCTLDKDDSTTCLKAVCT